MNYNQVTDAITASLGTMSVEDKPALVNLLQRSGSLVNEMNSQKELLDAAFKSIKDSKRFRTDLQDYLVAQGILSESLGTDEEKSFTDDDYYSNAKGQQTTAGKILGGIFNTDTLSKAVGIGMDYMAVKLQNQAAKQGNQQAIDFQVAQAQTFANQALANQAAAAAAAATPQSKGKNKWILPVAIGGGILLIGIIAFVALRKK